MASTAQHIAARSDADLLARFIAAAEMDGSLGTDDVSSWVQRNLGALITAPVDGTTTVTDVYAYALDVRNTALAALPPLPGINPGAVTDIHLATAIGVVKAAV